MPDKRTETAEKLHQWASKEMHFIPQGRYVNAPMPTSEDFKDICRGNLLSVWQYVLQHVHSTQKVHKVKGNLALKTQVSKNAAYRVKYQGDTKFSAEREAQLKKRRDLRAKVAGIRSDIQHLDQFLQNLQSEILSAEEQYQASCDELTSIQQKRALLSQYSTESKADVARYGEYRSRLENRLKRYQSSGDGSQSDTRYYSRQGTSHGQRTDSPVLETECTKNVRDTCGEVTTFLSQLLQGKYHNGQNALQKAKDKIWTHIEQVMSESSPQDVLQSLATITMETASNLRQATANINIEKDAEDLRFKYESGSLSPDVAPTGSSSQQLQSVHQMIEEKQTAHLNTFKEAEKSRNRAWKVDKQLAETVSAIEAKLAAMYSGNPGALDLARKLLSTELELASSVAAFQCLRSMKDNLAETAATEGKEKDALYAKYQKIQDFKGLSEQKQNLIQVLVRQNMDARKKLKEKQQELERYMNSKLCSHKAGTVAMTTQLKDRVAKEVERFASLPIHLLQVTALDSGDSVPVCHLSINRLTDQSPSAGGGVLQEVLKVLKFPLYKAPECLLSFLTDVKVEMADIQGILASHKVLSCYGDGQETGTDIIKHIQGLCQEVQVHDEEQTRRLLPMLQTRLKESSQALNHCIKAKDHLTAWWEQPSQHLTPWVKVDGLGFQQWMDKWTMAATQLRQMDN